MLDPSLIIYPERLQKTQLPPMEKILKKIPKDGIDDFTLAAKLGVSLQELRDRLKKEKDNYPGLILIEKVDFTAIDDTQKLYRLDYHVWSYSKQKKC